MRAFVCGIAGLAAIALIGGSSDERTYSRDIAPVMARKCVPCHTADGPGPFPLETYSQVKNRDVLVRYVLLQQKMPPQSAVSEMGNLREFEPMTDREVLALQEWVQGGSPEGAKKDPSAKVTPAWRLGKPDLVVTGGEKAKVTAEGAPYSTELRVKLPIDISHRIRAIDLRPKRAKVWRRALVARAFPSDEHKSVWDPYGLRAGRIIGGWSLGDLAWRLPKGDAIEVKPGDDLAVIPLWQPSGREESGEFEVALYFDDQAQNSSEWMTMGKADFVIPAQDGFTDLTDSTILSCDTQIVSILPEARLFARMIRLDATLPNGNKKAAFLIRSWDSEWAGAYNFEKPVSLPKGTRLDLTITYDNSGHSLGNLRKDPDPIHFGATNNDELFWMHLQVIPRAQ